MKRFLKIVGVIVYVVALVLVAKMLWQLPLASILDTLRSLTFADYVTWILINVVVILLLTYRWQLLMLMLQARVTLGTLLQIRQGGQAATFLIPGPHLGGEPLQLYWLCKRCTLSLPKAILGLGLDRLFELGLNALIFIASVVLLLLTTTMDVPDWQPAAVIAALLCVALLLFAKILQQQPQWLSPHLERFAQHWRQHEQLRQFSQQWQTSWQQIRSDFAQALATEKRRLLLAALFSVLGWLAMLAELALLLYFLGITPDISDVVLLVVAMRAALLLPAPGGIGPVEAALLWVFQLLDLPLTAAASLIVMMRLRDLVILLIGLACAYNLGRGEER